MIEFNLLKRNANLNLKYTVNDIGLWLDSNMPNPFIEKGVEYKPRWELDSYRCTIKFANDEDATWFGLMFP